MPPLLPNLLPNLLPESTNLYTTLDTPLSAAQVASLYATAGWQLRACGWAAWEVRQPWAELVIESAEPVLLHGRVEPERAREALEPLEQAGLAYQAELYDASGELGSSWSG